jgi:Metal binding domain of Ada
MTIDTPATLSGSVGTPVTLVTFMQLRRSYSILKKAPEYAQAYLTNVTAHAAHAHPYQRTTAEATRDKENHMSFTRGAIHGNRKSNIYHLPGCAGYECMSPANMVPFASEAEAVAAGYRKAGNCR